MRTATWVALALGLTSCATTSDFSSWAVSYNNSVSSATNRLTLLNIMRASEDMPLLFTGMMVVRGAGNAAAGLNVGYSKTDQFTLAGGATSDTLVKTWAPGMSLQVSSGFNFDVVVLDSAEFYQGLLTPVGIEALHALSKRGVPAELILFLMVDRITLTVNNVSETVINDPADPNYERFRTALKTLLKYGLTTEQQSVTTPMSPLLSDAEVKASLPVLFTAAQAGITPMPEPGGFRLAKTTTSSRLCFMGVGPDVPDLPQGSLCTGSPKKKAATGPARPEAALGGGQTLSTPEAQMSMQTRSTRDIYSYLGRLARRQTDAQMDGVTLDLIGVPAYQVAKGKSMFRVAKNSTRADDLVAVEYRGNVYSLPNEGYTSTVLTVLHQFFSLSKSINSVPNVGTVVVR